MLLANLYANADDAVTYAGRPPRPATDAGLYGLGPGYRLYPTADGWLLLAVTTDDEWRRAAGVLGLASLPADGDALVTAITDALASATADEWQGRFVAAGLAGVRADGTSPGRCWAHDEQVLANGFTPVCTHTRFGPHRRWGPIVRIGDGPPTALAGVLSGVQTDAILAELGRSTEEIAALRAAGVVASEPIAWA
jgi:crotonobetainyl-CoA:carnitine CoA-transferase CaiB-like acyl-CoA transferase